MATRLCGRAVKPILAANMASVIVLKVNDLIVIEIAEANMAFKRAFDARFAGGELLRANHSDAPVVAVYNTSTTFGRVTSRPHFTRATNSTMIKGSAAKATPDHSDAARAFPLSLSIRLGNVPCMTVATL